MSTPDRSNTDNHVGTDSYIGDELELFTHAKNWKAYWSAKIRPLLAEPVLEVGAGIGSNLGLLRTKNQQWLALEPDQGQVDTITENLGSGNADKLEIVCGISSDLNIEKRFRTIIYIDVLEHIEHDADEVKRASTLLESGGRLIVLSPAHNRLFSPFDKAVGHFRRYNKKTLRALTPDNTQIEQLYYLDSVGCLASFANAKLLKSSMPNKKQVLLWDRLMIPISRILDVISFNSIGKTIVVVWQKQ